MQYALFRSRGPAWLGGLLLNSLTLVLSTRSTLARPSGWICWLAAPTQVEGLGWSLWGFVATRLRCSLALTGVEVAWSRNGTLALLVDAGCDFRLFMSV